MAKRTHYNFVLWADHCEETAATIFITELRKAGLRVKVVGLSRKQATGVFGMALVPDLTLEQALPLAAQTRCFIIPCSLQVAQRLKNAPHLQAFLDQARANRAKFVIGQTSGGHWDNLGLPAARDEVVVYPDSSEALMIFARDMAASLLRN